MNKANQNAAFEIEVFRPGSFTAMSGEALTYSAEDLSAIADAYDADSAPAPVVIGHPATDAPAYGWIDALRYDGEASRLIAKVGNVVSEFAEALEAKRYRKVSMALFKPDAANNPKPGTWYAKHLGFLGAAAPAVSGLKPVELAGDPSEAVIVEFSAAGFKDAASLFRRMRDFMIDQFGLEKADEVLPGWEIDWLDERADSSKTHFSEPKEPAMAGKTEVKKSESTDFAEREAALSAREADIAEREAKARSAEHDAFCEALIADGRLLAAKKAETVAMLDTLAGVEGDVAFAGEDGAQKKSALNVYKSQLETAPKQVEFGSSVPPAAKAPAEAAFAAPAGATVDADALETHERAVAFQREHPDTDYLAAVRAVS